MGNPNPSPGTRFKPGSSGNPGGRRNKPMSKAIREILGELDPKTKDEISLAIARAIIARALKGDVRAAEFLADRAEGKVPDKMMLEAGTRLPISDADLAALLLNRDKPYKQLEGPSA